MVYKNEIREKPFYVGDVIEIDGIKYLVLYCDCFQGKVYFTWLNLNSRKIKEEVLKDYELLGYLRGVKRLSLDEMQNQFIRGWLSKFNKEDKELDSLYMLRNYWGTRNFIDLNYVRIPEIIEEQKNALLKFRKYSEEYSSKLRKLEYNLLDFLLKKEMSWVLEMLEKEEMVNYYE
jgi:hypothetical protein